MAALVNVEDIEQFLNTFESQMTLCGVDDIYWMAHLLPLLDSNSRSFHEHMPPAEKTSFPAVRAALLLFHGMTPAHYQHRWKKLAARESFHQVPVPGPSSGWRGASTTTASPVPSYL